MSALNVRISVLFVTLGVAASSCAAPRPPFERVTGMYFDPEAYQVYSAILPQNQAYANWRTLIIRGETVSYPYPAEWLNAPRKYQALVDPAIADYKRVNRSRWKLAPLLNISKKYEIVPENEFAGGWFRPRSPYLWGVGGHPEFVELSAVGFSVGKTIAVVYMTHNCGPMCSGGDVIALRKQGGEWKELVIVEFWKS